MLEVMKNLRNGKPQKIVAYGTSLTAKGAWSSLLADKLNKSFPCMVEMVNCGQSAMNSQWGVENLSRKVLVQKPDILFVEFAVNDAFLEYKISVSAAYINLKYIIERVAEDCPNCKFVLMTMNPPTGIHLEKRPDYERYYQIYENLAKELSLTMIDNCKVWKNILEKDEALFKKLVPDGLHPSPYGDELVTFKNIADRFFKLTKLRE